jgi:hypothetical protein
LPSAHEITNDDGFVTVLSEQVNSAGFVIARGAVVADAVVHAAAKPEKTSAAAANCRRWEFISSDPSYRR